MTLRFTSNNSSSSGANYAANALWTFYSFMTAASPTGPGWIVRGTSNGTNGGMGDTTRITSAASLVSQDAWFVLRAPSGVREILFHRNYGGGSATAGQAFFLYNYAGDYTGATPVLPTSPSGASQTVTSSTTFFADGYYNIAADDAAPYGFLMHGWSGTTELEGPQVYPIDNPPASDLDPYVYAGPGGTKAWRGDRSLFGSCGVDWLVSYDSGFGTVCPGAGPPAIGTGVLGLPLFFADNASPATRTIRVKGFTTFKYLKANDFPVKVTLNSYAYITSTNYVYPWDGVTEPL